ncbi:MAG: XRE family transcriptional regulator [Bryobacterales bacterium]|nr:XRE family transcriptional regulator [Bryobacterales bacterium]
MTLLMERGPNLGFPLIEEMSLHQLRQARELTQTKIAEDLHIGQGDVSKLERRTDMYVSTLASYLQAVGADLEMGCSRLSGNWAVIALCYPSTATIHETILPSQSGRKRGRTGRTRVPRTVRLRLLTGLSAVGWLPGEAWTHRQLTDRRHSGQGRRIGLLPNHSLGAPGAVAIPAELGPLSLREVDVGGKP